MKINKPQRIVFADLAIGGAMFLLAYLLKDSTPEAQTQGLIAIMFAIFLRLKRQDNNTLCNDTKCLRGSSETAGE